MVDQPIDPEWQRVLKRLKELDDETDRLLRKGNRDIMWTCGAVVISVGALIISMFTGGSCT